MRREDEWSPAGGVTEREAPQPEPSWEHVETQEEAATTAPPETTERDAEAPGEPTSAEVPEDGGNERWAPDGGGETEAAEPR